MSNKNYNYNGALPQPPLKPLFEKRGFKITKNFTSRHTGKPV